MNLSRPSTSDGAARWRHSHALAGLRRGAALSAVAAVSWVGVATTSPAFAQPTGSHIGRDATAKDGITAIRLMAKCYYRLNPKNATLWLDTIPGLKAERILGQRDAYTLGRCLDDHYVNFAGATYSFEASILRRPLAAEMARNILLGNPSTARPNAEEKPWFYSRLKDVPADQTTDALSLAVQDFGHCVALAQWDASKKLIVSEDESPEERAAVAELIPALGPCLTAGSTIKITKRNLREMIGEPVYHLLLASQGNGKH